ncbi:gas vesicle protein K [Pirellulaceae bacterium SH501]
MNLTDAMESSLDDMSQSVPVESKNSVQGLGKIALAIIHLLHELLERQAIRRMENGTLTEDEIERVGQGLMLQSEAIDKLCKDFGVSRDELNIDLGPLGKLV